MFARARDDFGSSPSHAIISGGPSGIGLALARRLAAAGWHLTILARDPGRLAGARAALAASGTEIMAEPVDVTNRDAVERAVHAAVARLGPPKLLVASAAMAVPGRFDELPLAAYRDTMEVNYFGTLNLVRAALPAMRAQRGGRIVMISSGAALLGIYGYTAYAPSKFAVRGLAEALRSELAPDGIGVSVVCPPDTDTPQFREELRVRRKRPAASPAAAKCSPSIRSPQRSCAGFAAAGSPSPLDWRCRRSPSCTASSARSCIASGSIGRSRDCTGPRRRTPPSMKESWIGIAKNRRGMITVLAPC